MLGSPVSPVGTFGSNGWQKFTFAWNSGGNTSASLILHDFTATAIGNDFGTDDILVQAAVPEPGSLTLLCGALVTASLALRRRKK